MAGARKLQADIDRTLKKINEGIVDFDAIYETIQSTDGQMSKMKLEEDLKKEIKKLQRYRDQLKSWITTPDIKNKQPLLDCRSLIERRMEIFKIVERETKTKAYSKEGLMRDQTVSAEDRKRMKVRDWIQDLVSKLYDEVDTLDNELETLQEGAGSKLSKKDKETITTMENVIKNHKQHIDNLEIITRLLDDSKVDPDEVEGIKEDLDYYMEQAREVDYEADFGIYDAFDLSGAAMDNDDDDEDDGQDNSVGDDESKSLAPSVSTSSATVNTPTVSSTGGKTPVAATTSTSSSSSASTTTASAKTSSSSTSTTASSSFGSSTNKSATSTVPSKTGVTAPPPGLTATSSSSRSNESSSSTSPIASISTTTTTATAPANITSGGTFSSKVTTNTVTKVTTPVPNVPTTPVTPIPTITNKLPTTGGESMANVLRNKTATTSGGSTVSSTVSTPVVSTLIPTASVTSSSSVASVATVNAGTTTLAPSVANIIARAQQQQQQLQQQQQQQQASTNPTVSTTPLVNTSPSSVTKSAIGMPNTVYLAVGPPKGDGSSNHPVLAAAATAASVVIPEPILQNPWVPLSTQQLRYNANVLASSINHLPEAIDTERPKPYIPKQPYPTHNAFPQQPTLSLDIPNVFEHFNIDTLFFIFYYNQNSYHQYLAARELRKHAWRYHKKYTTWFLRGENENRTQSDTSETGTYLYFDYESGWCQRLKKEFTFEYSSLEDELI